MELIDIYIAQQVWKGKNEVDEVPETLSNNIHAHFLKSEKFVTIKSTIDKENNTIPLRDALLGSFEIVEHNENADQVLKVVQGVAVWIGDAKRSRNVKTVDYYYLFKDYFPHPFSATAVVHKRYMSF
jgi:hypothetical protein